MKNILRNGLILVVAIILVCTAFTLIACKDTTDNPNNNNNPPSESIDYTITVQRSSGQPFAGANVQLYPKDGSRPYFAQADANGTAVINAPKDEYTVKFTNIVNGYKGDDNYKISDSEPTKTFKLNAELISTPATKETAYELGSVLNDFSFTDVFGYDYKLSDLLKEKKAVVFNFWFINCYWCGVEFPEMKNAYLEYSNDIAVIAFNTEYSDTTEQVINYATAQYDLPFIIVDSKQSASGSLFGAFGFAGSPSTVVVDRQGVACFVESGALSEGVFQELFRRYSKEPYEHFIYFPEENTKEIPDVEAPSVEEVASTINAEGMNATYVFTDDAYNWPWVIDGDAITTSNSGKHNSFSIINATISAAKNQCIAFDYKLLTETNDDLFLVYVDFELMHMFSGVVNDWKTCYAYVPVKDNGEYDITFAFVKNETKGPEKDFVSIKNVRFVSVDEIDVRTENIYPAASGKIEGGAYSDYITPVFNVNDGYYHVGTEDGPLLLADLWNTDTSWANNSAWSYVDSQGLVIDLDGDGIDEDYTESFTMFAQIAFNSTRRGYAGVTEDIKTHLMALTKRFGKGHANEWLELCSYIIVYGSNGEVLGDPATGFGYYNAFEAVASESPDNQHYNTVVKNNPVMPRGIYFRFVPTETAIYRINSVGLEDTYCFLYDSNLRLILEADDDEDLSTENYGNFVIRTLLEKDHVYYFALDYKMVDDTGTFDFVINKLAASGNLWVHASGAEYTTILNENGEIVDVVLVGAVNYALGEDGVYHVKNRDGSLGSKIYVDMCNWTYLFPYNTIQESVNMTYYYCKLCGTKYFGSVEYFESQVSPKCATCLNEGRIYFEKRSMFELPTPVRDEDGFIRVMLYTQVDENESVNYIYVPLYELNTTEFVDYTNPDEYLKDLQLYGIKFTDYSDVMQKYVDWSQTEGKYPAELEAEGSSSHIGCIEATAELVEILNKFIVFGDYSISVNIDNTWLMMSYYYMYLE